MKEEINYTKEFAKEGIDIEIIIKELIKRSDEIQWQQTYRMAQIRKYACSQYGLDVEDMSDLEVRRYLKHRSDMLNNLIEVLENVTKKNN